MLRYTRFSVFRTVGSAMIGISAVLTALSLPAAVLEEVVVTATRRAQSVQDIPYNISAMTGDQLQAANVVSLTDLTRTIPGIAYADLGIRSAGVNNQLILRGLNANPQGSIGAFINNLTPAGVSTYMDNTPLFINLRLNDLERVEVLRGPQGTLYGAGSVGGTLRFIFNEPDPEKFAASFNAGFGSTEDSGDLNYSFDGVVNIPLSPVAALRVSAGYEEQAGFIDGRRMAVGGVEGARVADPANPFGSPLATEARKDVDDADVWYLRASLLWNITDSFQAQLTYLRQEDDAKGFAMQTHSGVPGAEPRKFDQYFASPLSREVDMVALELDVDLGFARLESSSSYTRNEDQNEGDLSGLAMINDIFAGGFAFGGFPATNGRLASYYDGSTEVESVAQEIRLISTSEGPWQWVAGFYYQDIKSRFDEDIFVPGFADYANTPGHPFTAFLPVPPFLSWANLVAGPPGFVSQAAIDSEIFFHYERPQDIEDIALFGELTYNVTDAWQVTAGVRVFWNENKAGLLSTFPLFGAIAAEDGLDPSGLNTAEGKDDVQDQIFKLNTSYDINDDMMVYFTWAEGFRRGGANAFPLTGFNSEDPVQLSYQSDAVTNYEIGIKGNLFDNRMSYTAVVFRVDWDDPQVAGTFLPSGFGAVFNAEEARTQGVELEGRFQVTNEWQITAGYTYTDAEFTRDFATPLGPSDLFPDSQAADGDKLPGVPESIATWAIDYVRPVSFMGSSEIHLRLDGYYRSSVTTAPSPVLAQYEELDGYDIWNASLNWSNEKWRVSAYVKNIGDTDGITSVLRDFSIAEQFQTLDMVTRPRTIGLIFGYTF